MDDEHGTRRSIYKLMKGHTSQLKRLEVRLYSLLGAAMTVSILMYKLSLRFLYRNWVVTQQVAELLLQTLNPMHQGIGFQAAMALTLGALFTKRLNIGLFPLAVAPNQRSSGSSPFATLQCKDMAERMTLYPILWALAGLSWALSVYFGLRFGFQVAFQALCLRIRYHVQFLIICRALLNAMLLFNPVLH